MNTKEKRSKIFLKTTEEVENHTVAQLEETIYQYCCQRSRANKPLFDDKHKAYLFVRKNKLDSAFEWTAENKEKLLCLNAKMIDCFEKIKVEAFVLYGTLEKRINKNDDFLHDYMIGAQVYPSSEYTHNNDGSLEDAEILHDEIYSMLSTDLENKLYVGLSVFQDNPDDTIIPYLDKKNNCNSATYFNGAFDDVFISQAIHELYDNTNWSLPDILKINDIASFITVHYINHCKF